MALFINLLASRKIIGGCVSSTIGQLSRTNFTGNNQDSDENKKQKKPEKLLVNLVDVKRSVSVIAKEDAEKIAKSKGLVLAPVENPPRWMLISGKRPVYELLNPRAVDKKSVRKREAQSQGFKGMKHLALQANISDHDLEIKVKQALRFLEKDYKVSIRVDSSEEAVASKLKKLLQNHGFTADLANSKKNMFEYSPMKKETQSTAADTLDNTGKFT